MLREEGDSLSSRAQMVMMKMMMPSASPLPPPRLQQLPSRPLPYRHSLSSRKQPAAAKRPTLPPLRK